MGVLVPTDSSGRQPGLHQAEYDFLQVANYIFKDCLNKDVKVAVSVSLMQAQR